MLSSPCSGGAEDGGGKRMLATVGEAQQIRFVNPRCGRIRTTRGRPSVSVPVLSDTIRIDFSQRLQRIWCFSTPSRAPRPDAHHDGHGRAQGQATTRIPPPRWPGRGGHFRRVGHRAGWSPSHNQSTKVSSAARMTAVEPSYDIGQPLNSARLRCACATICTMCASVRHVCCINEPVWFNVVPATKSPGAFPPASPRR